jgi:hypothetical protein
MKMRYLQPVAVFLAWGVFVHSVQADERSAPTLANISGKWSFASVVFVPASDSKAADAESMGDSVQTWAKGTIEITEDSNAQDRSQLTGVLTLKDGTRLMILGRRRGGDYGSPTRIEFLANGSLPNEFGGPPTELEYEFEGRFSPAQQEKETHLTIRGLVQATRSDCHFPEYTVGAFVLTPAKIASAKNAH